MKLPEDRILLKKLFTNGLSPEERERLNKKKYVNNAIEKQWNATFDFDLYIEERVEKRIWENIMRRMEVTPLFRRNLYRYGWVASIALLLTCGALLVTLQNKKPRQEVWYVLNSGYQSMQSVMLADGTSVMLNAGSRLTYPKHFAGEKREVTLSGQAFFNVYHDPKHPFIVNTKNMNVICLGTEFEVFSFDHNKNIETILLQGKVRVETKNNKGCATLHNYILYPNEKLTYDREAKVRIEHVDADSYSAWRSGGRLSFRNAKLSVILPRLEEWYGQKIVCPSDIADHYRFTFTVHNESLDLILNMMSSSVSLNYKLVRNDHYIINKKK